MSIHRVDRPNAPYRIRKSTLDEKKWMYAHFVSPFIGAAAHHVRRGFDTREDAMAAAQSHAEGHRAASVVVNIGGGISDLIAQRAIRAEAARAEADAYRLIR